MTIFKAPLIYATIVAIILALAFLIYYCIDKYLKLKDNTKWTWTSEVSSYFSLGATWLAIGIIAAILLLVIILLVIALFKRLRLAIQLICEGSKAVQNVFLTLFFPIFPLILELAVLLYFIATSIYLSTAGKKIMIFYYRTPVFWKPISFDLFAIVLWNFNTIFIQIWNLFIKNFKAKKSYVNRYFAKFGIIWQNQKLFQIIVTFFLQSNDLKFLL